MKKYKFIVKKLLEKQVEIKADNKEEAVVNLVEIFSNGTAIEFENIPKEDTFYEAKLEEIVDIKNDKQDRILLLKNVYSDEEIEETLDEKQDDFLSEIKDDLDEIEDDFPKEYTEIVCEKCGNCILVDEDMLS